MTVPETFRLLVSSGDGPRECRRAVSLILNRMEQEAISCGIRFSAERSSAAANEQDPSSALVTLSGPSAAKMANAWAGTVQWTCPSPFRPHHKRRNWFAGVFAIEMRDAEEVNPKPEDLKIETFRSGGPGGQHQNTTDSGVRITHLPTGISAIATDERSQHRNKQAALERLAARLVLEQHEALSRDRSAQNQLHKQLERGNPVRVFKGEGFTEVN
ncbi:peptide chain release factor [Pannonibacter phragmitetus]|uniref:peptide chain release factor H n=1 Tax=Pannonibacter phragmitetus TaxID=121719 RepID=UPI00067D3AED|nr:peptide chain release factor H [Pannonibacter phragmitetus]KND16895.1 peptide chain release factor [Pannonibacter phragmitetus]MBA4204690.1 peptide chain release factor H [Polymorphum sp.]